MGVDSDQRPNTRCAYGRKDSLAISGHTTIQRVQQASQAQNVDIAVAARGRRLMKCKIVVGINIDGESHVTEHVEAVLHPRAHCGLCYI